MSRAPSQPTILGAHTMHQALKVAAIAYVAIVIAKRVPVLRDYL
ncbi:hypothetical protein [uncultured Dechloromonas sp.]|nr:hypothetical protein [uncultured Dechloromonas sp.]